MRIKRDKFEGLRFSRLVGILIGLGGLMIVVGASMGNVCS